MLGFYSLSEVPLSALGGVVVSGTTSAVACSLTTSSVASVLASATGNCDVVITSSATAQVLALATTSISLALTTSGAGSSLVSGAGSSSISIQTEAEATAELNGAGTSTIAITSEAIGSILVSGSGEATISVSCEGAGGNLVEASGSVQVNFGASGEGQVLRGGVGSCSISLACEATASKTANAAATCSIAILTSAVGAVVGRLIFEESLQAYLGNIVGLPQTYPNHIPQGMGLPAISFARVSSEYSSFLSNATVEEAGATVVYEFDIFADTYNECKDSAAILRDELEGFAGEFSPYIIHSIILENETDAYETPDDGSASGTYHLVITYRILYGEVAGSENVPGSVSGDLDDNLLEESLMTHLLSVSSITELVGSRIYPVVIAQSGTLPALTLTRTSTEFEHFLSDETVVESGAAAVFSFDCFATSYLDCKEIASTLRVELSGFSGVLDPFLIHNIELIEDQDEQDEPDDGSDLGVHQIALQFRVLFRETSPSQYVSGAITSTAIHKDLSEYLLSTEIVGEQVYPLSLPQTCALPAITWSRGTGGYGIALTSSDGTAAPLVTISTYSTSFKQAKQLARDVRNEFSGYRGSLEGCSIHNVIQQDEADQGFPSQSGTGDLVYAVHSQYLVLYAESVPVF